MSGEEYGDAIPVEVEELQPEETAGPEEVIDVGEDADELPEEPSEEPQPVEEATPKKTARAGFASGILARILPSSASSRASDAVKKRAVKLQTLTYDEETEEYTLEETATFFEDLPADAVHVTGKKNRYFRDLVEDPDYSDPTGIRATDLYLWMVNNSINDALAVKTKGLGEVDIRRYLVIGIGAIIGVCVIYAMI